VGTPQQFTQANPGGHRTPPSHVPRQMGWKHWQRPFTSDAHRQFPVDGFDPQMTSGSTPQGLSLQSVGQPPGEMAANAGVLTDVMTGTVHATAPAAAMRLSILRREIPSGARSSTMAKPLPPQGTGPDHATSLNPAARAEDRIYGGGLAVDFLALVGGGRNTAAPRG